MDSLHQVLDDPVLFCQLFFDFTPTDYQAELLRDHSKRIVVKWSRQSGKTTTIALRGIWYSLAHPGTLTLIVAPTLRQSMIMSDRVSDFLTGLPKKWYKVFVKKLQRTVITFQNWSRIVALPNSPQLLRGYTSDQVICDEAAFFQDDELVFYSVLYPMLATTNGTLIVSSTPWSTDSVFYDMCQNPQFSKHFNTWRDAVDAELIQENFIDEMKEQLPRERFQREFEAQFVEEVDTWLSQSLIVKSIGSELDPYDFQDEPSGRFYIGVDFGKKQDYSVVAVVEKTSKELRLVHVHTFQLGAKYASVIGYIKSLCDRWRSIRQVYCDITGVGEYIVEDMKDSGVANVEGVTFTTMSKEEMATVLREKMRAEELKIPYVPQKHREDVDLVSELNVERYELTKSGHIKFSHPQGTHDDVFWSVALAVYAAGRRRQLGLVDTGEIGEK